MAESFFIKSAKIGTPDKRFLVFDNFYKNPDAVRDFALKREFNAHPQYHKGKRTDGRFFAEGTKEFFEEAIGHKTKNFYQNNEYQNGIFQYCTAQDSLVVHIDGQDWAGAVYLNPEAPYEAGTSFYAHRGSGARHSDGVTDDTFGGGFYDFTKFDLVDTVGNVYNRLVLWDARLIHAGNKYFGQTKEDSRLFHLFFFNLQRS